MRELGHDRDSYRELGVAFIDNFVSQELRTFLTVYFGTIMAAEMVEQDEMVPGAIQAYGDPAFDTLLAGAAQDVGELLGLELTPTYSFARLYRRGHELGRHTDRPSCEHSISVHLASAGSTPWPLELEDLSAEHRSIELEPGTAIVYRGVDLPHWRRPCPVDWYLQLFLHYVAAGGEHGAMALDGRSSLGRPSVTPRRARGRHRFGQG